MKIAYAGDLHFGNDSDSPTHNKYLLEFIDHLISECKRLDVEEIHITGDYFDNRSKISLDTLHYALEGARKLSDDFMGRVVLITGNHDLYYKNRLDVASVDALERYMEVIKDTQFESLDSKQFVFCPWIENAERYDNLVNNSEDVDYIVGHFEFKNFYMNENYIMEHGQSHRELRAARRVITGHYHKRQLQDNVIYVGSPFPFDFNDANDFERGFMVLDTDTDEVEFHDWNKVKILSLTYDDFKEFKADGLIDEHTSVRIEIPDDADESFVDEAREEIESMEGVNSKINYKGNKAKELMESEVEINEIKDIDRTIVEAIRNISDAPDDVDVGMLESIYEQAKENAIHES